MSDETDIADLKPGTEFTISGTVDYNYPDTRSVHVILDGVRLGVRATLKAGVRVTPTGVSPNYGKGKP